MEHANISMKTTTKYWTEKELDYAKQHVHHKTYNEFAEDLDRTKLSVERKLHRMNIVPLRWTHPEWTYENVQYIKENESKKTYQEVANDLGKTVRAVSKKMRKLNIKPKQHQKFKSVNHNFFKVWSEQMAYIFGYWFADGNISSNGKKKFNSNFVFNIGSKDREQLEKISNLIESTYTISKRKKEMNNKEYIGYSLNVSSKEIYNDIIELGGCERKSLVAKFPVVPDEHIKHFIRGYFDGDGCVRTDYKYKTYPSIQFLGTQEFLSKLITYLPFQKPIKPFHNIYAVDYSGKSAQKILYYMYTNSNIYLNRKYKRYQETLKWKNEKAM